MEGSSIKEWIAAHNLQEVIDPDRKTPAHFRYAARPIVPVSILEQRVRERIQHLRQTRGISAEELTMLLGNEDPETTLAVGRLIHICEVLGISPEDVLAAVVPHLWAAKGRASDVWLTIIEELSRFDEETLSDIHALLRHLPKAAR